MPAGRLPDAGRRAGLPLPNNMSVMEYEEVLFPFLKERRYIELEWLKDKGVRDTGPWIDGTYYGTHPAVRVFYSPGIIRWLAEGRRGPIPDGEMMIKEQYPPPAERHRGKTEAELRESLESWTVMVKDSKGSQDGWFWSNPGADAKPFDFHKNNQQPWSGFGLYCVRCHASTQSPQAAAADSLDNEFTFASLRNIEGFPGQPIIFRVDDSWRRQEENAETEPAVKLPEAPQSRDDSALLAALRLTPAVPKIDEVFRLPNSSFDSVHASRDPHRQMFTSDQCMNCHAGVTGPFGPVGFVHRDAEDQEYGSAGVNVSPYGEWRWTPMGLAGRDPVFYAQLESELALMKSQFGETDESARLSATLVDTCLRCHGAMGHQHHHGYAVDQNDATRQTPLSLEDVSSTSETGALARDGISCMICHRMQPRPQPADDQRPYLAFFLETSTSGNIYLGSPGQIYGPYEDRGLASYPMHHATGWKPQHSNYIRQSQLCGSCHTVTLPAIDRPLPEVAKNAEAHRLNQAESVPEFQSFHHHIEQATYLEWLNSKFNNETTPNPTHGKSCQDCHMPNQVFGEEVGGLDQPIRTRIAAIQDDTYPDAENLAELKQLHVPVRDNYRRHSFAGLNVWLIEYFRQFDDVLGVKKSDYMTGSKTGAEQSIQNMIRLARRETATVEVNADLVVVRDRNLLEAKVRVKNLSGHRFPTGVGFRRAFLQLQVIAGEGEHARVIWSSGRTNEAGVILGSDDQPLPTELHQPGQTEDGHQPHYTVIESPDQVQIYETILKDSKACYTTSFVRACTTEKDNRLLPQGWTQEGPGGGLDGAYLKATHPGPQAALDPDYTDGSGSDTTVYRIPLSAADAQGTLKVQATLFYQATPPYYLRNLFQTAPNGEATLRLKALASHVDLQGTAIEGWKLPIAEDSATVSAASLPHR